MDYPALSNELPQNFQDKPRRITFLCKGLLRGLYFDRAYKGGVYHSYEANLRFQVGQA